MKHLFLDLEDTIITPVLDGWHNTELVNIDKIKKVILDFNPDFINIFSFAIHDDIQKDLFNRHTRPMIELALGVKINLIPTVDIDIKNACCNLLSLNKSTVDFAEMSNFWGKHQSFRLYCRHLFRKAYETSQTSEAFSFAETTEVFLLDDAVEHENFEWPLLKIVGTIRNIDLI